MCLDSLAFRLPVCSRSANYHVPRSGKISQNTQTKGKYTRVYTHTLSCKHLRNRRLFGHIQRHLHKSWNVRVYADDFLAMLLCIVGWLWWTNEHASYGLTSYFPLQEILLIRMYYITRLGYFHSIGYTWNLGIIGLSLESWCALNKVWYVPCLPVERDNPTIKS